MLRPILAILLSLCTGYIHCHARPEVPFTWPVIPDSITTLDDRTDYIALHFLDAMPATAFSDARIAETFFYLLAKINSDTIKEAAVSNLMEKMIPNPDLFSKAAFYFDFFVGTPESEYHDDSIYIFSQRLIIRSDLPDEYKIAPRHRIKLLAKNAPGTTAPDFSIMDREGVTTTFYAQTLPSALLFVSSECDRCHRELTRQSTVLEEARRKGWNILTVFVDGVIPENWSGDLPGSIYVDKEKIILGEDLYVVRRLPCIYLIDSDRKIIARELKFN